MEKNNFNEKEITRLIEQSLEEANKIKEVELVKKKIFREKWSNFTISPTNIPRKRFRKEKKTRNFD